MGKGDFEQTGRGERKVDLLRLYLFGEPIL